jgi:two-component system NtrC family sensor kinase
MVPRRLAPQLILYLTVLVAIIEGAFGLLYARRQERQVLDSMILGQDQLSRAIVSATWHAMLADQRDTAYEAMQTIATREGIDRIRIFNKEGRVMFSTGQDVGAMVDKRAEACFVCHAEAQPLVRVDVPSRARVFQGPDRRRKLGLITPIYNELACSEAPCHAHPSRKNVLGVLDVALDLGRVDRELARMKTRWLLVVAGEILLLAVFIALFSRRFVDRPIRALIAATKDVSAMRLDRPIEVRASQELEELAESFDSMRERLREALHELGELTHGLEAKVRERTEELERAHQKLLRSDRLASLGRLAASVAHEINNPLSGVLNLSTLMQRMIREGRIPPGREDEFRGYLDQVVRETGRVGRIVTSLLAFSRQSKPRRERADLNALVRQTVSIIDHKLALARVRLDLDLDPALPAVECDPSQMQQVVMNLAINGVEAMRSGGDLSLSTRLNTSGNAVVLEVRDTGIGIAPENLPRIFEPFFTTKEEGEGIGLGLPVVYGIVHGHGGDIEVETREGAGAVFRVVLPLQPADDAAAEPAAAGGVRT